MTSNLFVGGLPYETTQEELAKLFSTCGKVVKCKLILDRETGRSKGFGFVEMSSPAEAQVAMAKLNGTLVGQRKLFINEARPPEKRVPGAPGAAGASRPGPRPGGPSGGPSAPGGGAWGDKPFGEKRGPGGPGKKKWGGKGGRRGGWDEGGGGDGFGKKRGGGRPKDVEEDDRRSGRFDPEAF